MHACNGVLDTSLILAPPRSPTPAYHPHSCSRLCKRALPSDSFNNIVFATRALHACMRQKRNGQISRGEMHVALAQVGVTQDEIEKLFASIDVVS